MACGKEDCEAKDEKCEFKKLPRPAFAKSALKELESYISGGNKEKFLEEKLLLKLIESALSGDEKSIEFFTGETKVKLDGDVGEQHAEVAELILKLNKAKCL